MTAKMERSSTQDNNALALPMQAKSFECAVVGTGPAGMIAALALAKNGIETVLVGPPVNLNDARTTALMDASRQFLDNIGIWKDLRTSFTPLEKMRLIDGTDRLLRAPETTFDAAELNLPAFGYNILNKNLNRVLFDLVETCDLIERIEGSVKTVTSNDHKASLALADGSTLTCNVVIGADGRNSAVRRSAGIETKTGPTIRQRWFSTSNTSCRTTTFQLSSIAIPDHSPWFHCRASPRLWFMSKHQNELIRSTNFRMMRWKLNLKNSANSCLAG